MSSGTFPIVGCIKQLNLQRLAILCQPALRVPILPASLGQKLRGLLRIIEILWVIGIFVRQCLGNMSLSGYIRCKKSSE